jgi:hypothetical protein
MAFRLAVCETSRAIAMRILTILLGAGFFLQGLGWIVAPTRAAESLGMPLLDGLGRSTQIGDFGAFFLTAGATMLAGSRPGHARLLLVPAGMLASAAVVRTIAWLVHGAAFAPAFILVEVGAAVVLGLAARGER